jgi:hypothetical protein
VEAPKRFAGLKLTKKDRAELAAMQRKGKLLSARTWRRVRVLELLDQGASVRATANAMGTLPREVSRVGKRYVARGLHAALTDEPRGKPDPALDSAQRAAVVAMVCGPAPEGRARWTVRLVAEYAVRRGITPKIGRETADEAAVFLGVDRNTVYDYAGRGIIPLCSSSMARAYTTRNSPMATAATPCTTV